jgi:hypothetical protein
MKAFMGRCPNAWLAVLVSVLSLGADSRPTSTPSQDDEFVGPFPSWRNARTDYRAIGDGAADDTLAIQLALDELGKPGQSPVLFLPKGMYRITRPLVLTSRINVAVVGEDPDITVIVWDGPVGGTMLWINGVAYSRFTRLTFDGRRRASVAVDQSWDMKQPHFDTGNEYSDARFVDVEYGIHGGFKGGGFAETSIRRSRFVRNTKVGVALGNFNALDIWVWESLFEQCGVGLGNGEGAGNYHVYNSVFRGSIVSDLVIQNTGGFSARGNYSSGSKAFLTSSSGTNNPATVDLQGNIILDPIDPVAIRLGNQGPGLIFDNMIRSAAGASGPVINWTSFIDADVTSVGNTFTVPRPIANNGRLIAVGDHVVSRGAVSRSEPPLPSTRPNIRRRVIEVPPKATGIVIQQAIDTAVLKNGSRPVVHIPYGSYAVSQTLSIPPGSDVQLVGDGGTTVLQWSGPAQGTVLRLEGPSKATLRDLQFDGAGRADAILMQDIDQVGSRVYMDHPELRAGKETNLLVDGLDHTYLQIEDIGHASSDAVSVKVVGGRLSNTGKTTRGKTNIYSGASSNNRFNYEATGGAKLLVRDMWYESNAPTGFASVHDRALFTLDGSRVAAPGGKNPPMFLLTDLDGRVAILSMDFDDRIVIAGNGGRSEVLGLGVLLERQSSEYFANIASPPARAVLANSRQLSSMPGNRSGPTRNVGNTEAPFIERMLSHARAEHAGPLTALPDGVTDARLFRVWVTGGINNVVLRGQ